MSRLNAGLRCRNAVAVSATRATAPPLCSLAMIVWGDGTLRIASIRTSISSSLSSSTKLAF